MVLPHPPATARALIADYFEAQAWWRGEKAVEYAEDPRNARCSDALEELAAYVRALPDDDTRVAKLAACCATTIDETGEPGEPMDVFIPAPGEFMAYRIARFRFHHAGEDCDSFLSDLADLADEDRAAMLVLAGIEDQL